METRQSIGRSPLLPVCLAVLGALAPRLQAQPHLLADAELDQVCAKGTAGFNVDPSAINQMIFSFSRQTSLGQVTGSGSITVEVIASAAGKSQITLGPSLTIPGGAPTATGATPITISPTELQVVNGTVQVSGSLTIDMQTLPSVTRALQQNRVVLPPGFNPLGAMSGLGWVH